jgi:hypothetical protein
MIPGGGSTKHEVVGRQRAGETDEGDSVGCGSRRADDGILTIEGYDEIAEVRDARNVEL